MLMDTTKLIEHKIGDIIDVQIYHEKPNSIEIFKEDGKITGFGIKSDFSVMSSDVVFRIKINALDEKNKFSEGVVTAYGTIKETLDGSIKADMTEVKEEARGAIGGKYIGLTAMPSETGVEQYEAYIIPYKDGDNVGTKIGCLGRCERL